jgi:hypothetical protein
MLSRVTHSARVGPAGFLFFSTSTQSTLLASAPVKLGYGVRIESKGVQGEED